MIESQQDGLETIAAIGIGVVIGLAAGLIFCGLVISIAVLAGAWIPL